MQKGSSHGARDDRLAFGAVTKASYPAHLDEVSHAKTRQATQSVPSRSPTLSVNSLRSEGAPRSR